VKTLSRSRKADAFDVTVLRDAGRWWADCNVWRSSGRYPSTLRARRATSDQKANASLPVGAPARSRSGPFERVTRLAQAVTESLEVSEVLHRVAQAATELVPGSAARIWVVERDRLRLRSEAGTDGPAPDGERTTLAFGEGLAGHVAATQEPLVLDDVGSDPRVVDREWMRRGRWVSAANMPLLVRGELVGVLVVMTRRRHRFPRQQLRVLASFGTHAAIALENARLFEEQAELLQAVRHRRARLEALLDIGREVSTIQPVESLFERIARTCGELLSTDAVGIRLLDGDELVVAYVSGAAKDMMATQRLKVGESLSGLVAATGQALMVTDPATDERLLPAHRAAMQRLGYRALLAVPIKIADRVAGILSVPTRQPAGFSPEDLEIVMAFAGQAGTALHNARLYDEAQRAVEQLERTQDQLLQSQKMDAIGRLAGGIAHDFNNLLTIITGQSHILLTQVAPGTVRDGVERISLTADRAADLTRQLLAFSRNQGVQPRVLQLNAIVGDVTPMLQRLIGEDVQLRAVLDPALANVRADASQLQQVIMNLAANARDAMPQGGQLTIETASVLLDASYARQHAEITTGPYVMLAVSDTGVGMDAETRRRLFEPFYTTKDTGKGTGLGLAIVYGIVKQNGGHIWVYSEPGRGTTFKIYLPAVTDGVDRAPESTVDDPPTGSETVLLVEDEEQVRHLVRFILQNQGYTVLEAGTPSEALEIATRHDSPIDLLLTDVVMPQMNGRVLADLLKPERPGMAVLFISGYTANAVVQHGVLGPAMAYLQKPFTPDALARAVRQTLDRTTEH
jgi:signal transduction histidine kinase/ActR/RegA family two-component response regulator